jgi:hypothetical protein
MSCSWEGKNAVLLWFAKTEVNKTREQIGRSIAKSESGPQNLVVTPAMEAGITDHVWTIEEVVNLLSSAKVQNAA